MMKISIIITALQILLCNFSSHAFTSSSTIQAVLQFPDPSLSAYTPSRIEESEESEIALLNDAVDCSLADSCPVDEARSYLSKIEDVQDVCTIGTNPMEGDEFCTNQDVVAQVIDRLTEKIYLGERNGPMATLLSERISLGDTIATSLLVAVIFMVSSHPHGTEVTAFNTEEWIWAIRDGYFPMMVLNYIKEGGFISS